MKKNERLVSLLTKKHLMISFAESCTGGGLASEIISVPGSSEIIECSLVAYSDRIKNEMLTVNREILAKHTAVSREAAKEMAENIRKLSGADVGVSTTGYAGPAGADVGLVYIGLSYGKSTKVYRCRFYGGRNAVRRQAIQAAINITLSEIE